MRAVVQRVLSAGVDIVEKEASETVREVAAIGAGYLILVGVKEDDGPEDAQMLADKVAHLRVWEDESGKMNRSLLDVGGSALIVSNFTLYADCRKGRRPSFTEAARGDTALALYQAFGAALAAHDVPVAYGEFGAEMQVRLVNKGPVTLLLDSRRIF